MTQFLNSVSAVRFGVFEADLRTGELRKNGLKVKLADQPFQILAMLLERSRELVTREELQKKLWTESTFVDFEHGLNKAVNRIREALGDNADNPRFVETLPRRGYRFICPVAPVEPVAPVSSPVAAVAALYERRKDSAVTDRRYSQGARQVAFGILTLAAVLGAVLALNVAGLRDRIADVRAGLVPALGRPRGAPRPRIESIAVLPLENLSGDPEQEYFADGMTEEPISGLGKNGALRVISQTLAMHCKGTTKHLPQIPQGLTEDRFGWVEGVEQSAISNQLTLAAPP